LEGEFRRTEDLPYCDSRYVIRYQCLLPQHMKWTGETPPFISKDLSTCLCVVHHMFNGGVPGLPFPIVGLWVVLPWKQNSQWQSTMYRAPRMPKIFIFCPWIKNSFSYFSKLRPWFTNSFPCFSCFTN